MNKVKLIKLVSQRPELYSLVHPDFMNHKKKAEIWDEIGAALHLPGTTCKARWVNIKDTFRRILKKQLNNEPCRPYTYDHYLGWLKPYMTDSIISNGLNFKDEMFIQKEQLVDEDDDDSETITVDCPNFDQIFYVESDMHDVIDDEQNCLKKSETTTKLECKEDVDALLIDSQTNLKKRKINSSYNANAKKLYKPTSTANTATTTTIKSETIDQKQPTDDPIDAFLKGISSTIKLLSPYNQSLAKRNIFQVVHELEMAEIMAKNEDKKT